ncbi:MAG: type II secretion system F family protein [Phycisphaeraceae bacterium]|nr:type II secretion system F family protein [Phycisphaeraceae bacterium]MCW5762464.1 type II secretion system F family protein [Phycisphaeraceae bacterium]
MSGLRYNYLAADAAGKRVRGVLSAIDDQEACRKVAASGLTPLKVTSAAAWKWDAAFRRGISRSEVAAMTRELSVLVDARMPLAQGFTMMAQNERNPALAALMSDIAFRIESGAKISEAIEKHALVLGEVYVATMQAAESSGMLSEVTAHLAEMLDAEVATRQQLRRAATYPAIVLLVVSAALFVILGFVVPRFAATYASSGVSLPLATRIVQGLGESVRSWWWVYLGAVVTGIIGIAQCWASSSGRLWIETALSKVPYLGRLLTAVATARFCRVLSIACGAGIDLIEAIEVSAKASGSHRLMLESRSLTARLRGGGSLTDVVTSSIVLPPFAQRLLAASKESKEVGRSSNIISKHFEREGTHLTAGISTVIEPIMTVLLAVIVLTVALAVFLPMWQLIGASQ